MPDSELYCIMVVSFIVMFFTGLIVVSGELVNEIDE